MPEQIAQIDPVGSYAWVSMMGAISGIVLAPLAGALSDRTTSRFGRRRPWLIVGSLVCMATLVRIGIQTTVAGVAIGSLVLSAAFMIIGAGLSPVVPDQVPVGQRGVVLGWANRRRSRWVGRPCGLSFFRLPVTEVDRSDSS